MSSPLIYAPPPRPSSSPSSLQPTTREHVVKPAPWPALNRVIGSSGTATLRREPRRKRRWPIKVDKGRQGLLGYQEHHLQLRRREGSVCQGRCPRSHRRRIGGHRWRPLPGVTVSLGLLSNSFLSICVLTTNLCAPPPPFLLPLLPPANHKRACREAGAVAGAE